MSLHVLALSLALAAPAPFPKTTPPRAAVHSLVGSWTLTWGYGGVFQVAFSPDGRYCCDAGGRLFTGSWRLEGRLLVITETEVNRDSAAPGVWYSYRIQLEPHRLAGKVEGGDVRFELGPPSRTARLGHIQ
jgi:hypothetical protein